MIDYLLGLYCVDHVCLYGTVFLLVESNSYGINIYLLDSMLQSLGWTVSDLVFVGYIRSSVTPLNLFKRFESLLFKRDGMLFCETTSISSSVFSIIGC